MDNSTHGVITDGDISSEFSLPPQGWVAFVGLWLMALVTIIGNSMVIASFITYRDIKNKVSHLFLLNLAISDLTVGLVSLPLDNMWRWYDRWPYGRIPCLIWTFIDYTVTTTSVYSIVLISADRYLLIKKGLSYTTFQTKKRAIRQIATAWFISIGFHLLGMVWYETMHEDLIDFYYECELNALQYLPYTITAMFVEFLIPLGIVIVLYINIYANIRKRTTGFVTNIQRSKATPADESKDSGVLELSASSEVHRSRSTKDGQDVHQEKDAPGRIANNNGTKTDTLKLDDIQLAPAKNTSKNGLTQKNPEPSVTHSKEPKKTFRREKSPESGKHRQAAKMLSILVGIFIICWLPYNITTMADVINKEQDISWQVWDMVNYLLWFNSAVNPILYACTNIYFRRGFYNILRWLLSPCCKLKVRY